MKKLILILVLAICSILQAATIYTAPAAQCTGTAAEDATSSNAIGNPTKLSFVMDDLAAEGQCASGDTIQFAAGTYSVAGGDFANTGLAPYAGASNFAITFKSASGNPDDTIIDFVGVSAGVEGFNITSTAVTKFDGLTVKNSNAVASGNEAEIEKADGELRLTSCIIGSDGGGFNGVTIHSVAATATCYLKDCEVYGMANDGVSAKDDGVVATAQDITATNCYFHDINTATSSQAITIHNGGTARMKYCRVINCGKADKTSGGAIGNDDDPNNNAYVYGCYIKDSAYTAFSPGTVEVANCYIENSSGLQCSGVSTGKTATLVDSVIYETTAAAYYYFSSADTRTTSGSIKRCAFYLNSTSNSAWLSIGKVGGVDGFTIEDSLVYNAGTTNRGAGNIILATGGTFTLTNNIFYFVNSGSGSGYFNAQNTGAVVFDFDNNIFIAPSGQSLTRSDTGSSQTGTYNYYSTGMDEDVENRWTWGATDTVSTTAALIAKFPLFAEFVKVKNYRYKPSTMTIGTGIPQTGSSGWLGN